MKYLLVRLVILFLLHPLALFATDNITEKVYLIPDCQTLKIQTNCKISLTQNVTAPEQILIKAPASKIDQFQVLQKGVTCQLSYLPIEPNVSHNNMIVSINLHQLQYLHVMGGGELKTQNSIKSPKFSITVQDTSQVKMQIETDIVQVYIQNTSTLLLCGNAGIQHITGMHHSQFDGKDLLGHCGTVNLQHHGKAMVHLIKKMQVNLKNYARLGYYGKPVIQRHIGFFAGMKDLKICT